MSPGQINCTPYGSYLVQIVIMVGALAMNRKDSQLLYRVPAQRLPVFEKYCSEVTEGERQSKVREFADK